MNKKLELSKSLHGFANIAVLRTKIEKATKYARVVIKETERNQKKNHISQWRAPPLP
jgi:hypothetical protein